MIEGDANSVAFDAHILEDRPAEYDVGLAIGLVQSEKSETAPDFLFIGGMDVFHIADVIDDGHAGIRNRLRGGLRFPKLGESFGIAAVVIRRDLDEVEG